MPWDSLAMESAWKTARVAYRPASYAEMMERCIRRDMEVSTVLGSETRVDILLPLGESLEGLTSLMEQIGSTNVRYQMMFLDDKIKNEEVLGYVEDYCQEHESSRVIHNERKIGVVSSLNRGLVISRADYVVLLGAEVTLPDMWLERLVMPMIKDPTVSSVTPFTNHGLIAGFPVPSRRNRLFDDEPVEKVDEIFGQVRSLYTTIPYGVGFCMAMNREVIHKIGILDQQNYKALDGADIDWALRAARAGYRNVMAENLYVKNDRFSAEMLEGERMLSRKQEKILMKQAPEYKKVIEAYEAEDPLSEIRAYAFSKLVGRRSERRRIIFHMEGEVSADNYMRRYIDDKLSENESVLTVQYNREMDCYFGTLEYDHYRVSFQFDDLSEVMELGEHMESRRIILGRLTGFPQIGEMLKTVRRYADDQGSRLVLMLLDYFTLCPQGKLLNAKNQICQLTEESQEVCRLKGTVSENSGFTTLAEWRKMWRDFLRDVQEVLYYSDSLLSSLERSFGVIEKSHKMVKPDSQLRPVNRVRKRDEDLNIWIPGPLNRETGLDYVKAIVKQAEREKAKIHFYVRGTMPVKSLGRLVTNVSREEDSLVPAFLLRYDIDACLIPDAGPDAIGMRAKRVTELEIPAMTRNVGETAHVMSRYKKGKILSENPAQALEEIIEFAESWVPKRSSRKEKILFITTEEISNGAVIGMEEWLWIHGIRTIRSTVDSMILHARSECHTAIVDGCHFSRRLKMVLEDRLRNGTKIWYLQSRSQIIDEESIRAIEPYCEGFLVEEKRTADQIRMFTENKPIHVIHRRKALSEKMLSDVVMKAQRGRDRLHLYAGSGSKGRPQDAFVIGWMHDGGKTSKFTQEDCMKVVRAVEKVMHDHVNMRFLVSEKIMLDRDQLQLRERMLPIRDESKKDRWLLLSQCDVVIKPLFGDNEPSSGSEEMAAVAGIPVIKASPEEIPGKLMEIMGTL